MTKVLPPRSVLFRKQVTAAREKLAEELFDVGSVFQTMTAAVTKGEAYVIVTPPLPVDLVGTKAAQKLLAALTTEGFETKWERCEHPVNRGLPAFFSLLIRWDAAP